MSLPSDRFTERARKVVELAGDEARNLRHKCVGTEHLLLGILREGSGVAAEALKQLGVSAEAVKAEVASLLRRDAPTVNLSATEKKSGAVAARGGLYELRIESTFAAAHRLREYQGECERLHGHNWRMEVVFAGADLNPLGMLMDFRDAKRLLAETLDRFDHADLNECEPFKTQNPTTENLARVVSEELACRLPKEMRVQSVTAWESDKCGVTWRPNY